jgi:type III pantothenate kinase
MFLAVDIGNTHCVLGVYDWDEQLRQVWRISSNPSRTEDEVRMTLAQLFRESGLTLAAVRGCVVSSTIPRLAKTFREALAALLGRPPLILTNDLDLGVENRYHHPEDVGADRLANAVGGIERYGAPLIVVDFGTATTFDVVTRDKAYLGGIIMPGLEMSADALFQKTSRLPRIAIEPPARVVGRSTRESIASGILRGSAAAVDRLIEQVREEIAEPECPVVATGGLARTVVPLTRHLEKVDDDLTLYGLLRVWLRNVS